MFIECLTQPLQKAKEVIEDLCSVPIGEIFSNTQEEIIKDASWVQREFESLTLSDERLTKRLKTVAEKLFKHPSVTINQAGGGNWPETKAAYNFFDNKKADEKKIFKAHQEQTVSRIKSQSLILAIQDTVYFNFTHHPKTKGLGPIGTKEQHLQGLIMHETLAVTPDGLPLGLLTQKIWHRNEQSIGQAKQRKQRPIEEKESYKWLEALEEVSQLDLGTCRVVSVCDCESDIFEFMHLAEQRNREVLIRAAQNRVLDESDEYHYLWDKLEAQPILGHLEVEIPPQKEQPGRTAIVSVQLSPVTIKPPKTLQFDDFQPLEVYAILVKEEEPPENIEALEWMLLTNRTVTTFEEAIERIRWYRGRWSIEVYHKVLKSGCTVEDCHLQTGERLTRYLVLMSIIAWRLYWMTQINRTNPEAPCTEVLEAYEWQALYCYIFTTIQMPNQIPTVGQVVRWIAKLGGFMGRKGDKEPGVTVLWKGWQRLSDLAEMWLIMHSRPDG